MLTRLTQWLTNPAARRYVGVMAAFMTVSVVLTIGKVEEWLVWLLLIVAWIVADTRLVVGTGLTRRQRLLILFGLLVPDVILTVLVVLYD